MPDDRCTQCSCAMCRAQGSCHGVLCCGRTELPRAVLGVHAAFHVLYTALAWRVPRWCVDANITRVEASPLLCPPGALL